MANENTQMITLIAATGADVRARRFVIQGSTGVSEATDGADAVGVNFTFYDDSEHTLGNASRAVSVVTNNGCRVEVEAGAAVTVGADIASDAEGRAIVASATAPGDAILGVALTAAAAAGEVVEVLFQPAGRIAT